MTTETVTTRAEAEALPVMAVVIDAYGGVCTRVSDDPVFGWVRATQAIRGYVHRHGPYLPGEVVYRPRLRTTEGDPR